MVGERRFTKDEIESAFHEAIALGHVIELSVYGGAAIMLAYAKRQMTRDVDAVFEQSKQVLNKISRDIAAERGWPEDWLNDGVKGWISSRDGESESKRLFRSYPAEDNAGLRVMVAAPRYLFAMKCMAMRIDAGDLDESTDVKDIQSLAEAAGIFDAETALDVVSYFYPKQTSKPATQLGIEEIFENWVPEKPAPKHGM